MAQNPQTKNERRNKMKKIMFNDAYGLTDAVLQGRKTMTRRIVGNRMTVDDIRAYLKGYTELADKCAQYKIGDVVAVAQPYKSIHEEMMNGDYGNSRYDAYRCAMVAGTKGWNNKMFVKADLMPHQIRITGIKVERLQYITEYDAHKEGICYYNIGIDVGFTTLGLRRRYGSARSAFAALIDKISGKGTWERNPYVFAYTFELVK